MKLAVGFITYNEASAVYLPYFLPSLQAALAFLQSADYQVLVFDNSRRDYLVNQEKIADFQKSLPGAVVQLEAGGHNLGFSRAYNILINKARENGAQYFLMINPDTLLEASAVAVLVQALDQEPLLAAVSPKIRFWDFSKNQTTEIIDSVGLVLRPGLKFIDLGQGETDHGQFDEYPIFGPSGAAGLFRLAALEKIKENGRYLDERFFMYKEDCDLCYRLFISGQVARLVPGAVVYHDRTVSRGLSLWQRIIQRRQRSRQIRSWSFLNQHLIFVKHWHSQNLINRVLIIYRVLIYLIFSLILEQYNLKNYFTLFKSYKVLTNVK